MNEESTQKTRPSNIKRVLLGIATGSLLFVAYSTHNIIFLYPQQMRLMETIESGLMNNNGLAQLRNLLPGEIWDEVCIVPAYSFAKSPSELDKIRRYLGYKYQYRALSTPDPMSLTYGLGFAFLHLGALERFVLLPASRSIQIPTQRVGNKNYDRLYFSDLSVRPQRRDKYCYPRDTAFIRINTYQDITIGG